MLYPAIGVINRFEGAIDGKNKFEAVAQICGVDVSRVYRWTHPKDKPGGTGGRVPGDNPDKLLRAAPLYGVRLEANDFFVRPQQG